LNSITLLLTLLDQAYDHPAWHGTNLKGAIRRLNVAEAAWRPSAKRHNIWEIVVHCAYWKYAVRRRILAEKRGSFALKGSNWFYRYGVEGDAVWKADLALLEESHLALRASVASLAPP
jgi:hypothetical protein